MTRERAPRSQTHAQNTNRAPATMPRSGASQAMRGALRGQSFAAQEAMLSPGASPTQTPPRTIDMGDMTLGATLTPSGPQSTLVAPAGSTDLTTAPGAAPNANPQQQQPGPGGVGRALGIANTVRQGVGYLRTAGNLWAAEGSGVPGMVAAAPVALPVMAAAASGALFLAGAASGDRNYDAAIFAREYTDGYVGAYVATMRGTPVPPGSHPQHAAGVAHGAADANAKRGLLRATPMSDAQINQQAARPGLGLAVYERIRPTIWQRAWAMQGSVVAVPSMMRANIEDRLEEARPPASW